MRVLCMHTARVCIRTLLLQRLAHQHGLTGVVLQWLTSFVTGRTQQVAYDGQLSSVQPSRFGVPQGSILGPLLFVVYTDELHQVVSSHGLTLHQYADDCLLWDSRCLTDVGELMGSIAGYA